MTSTDQMRRHRNVGYMLAVTLAVSAAAFTPQRAHAVLPVEAAEGYKLNEVCPGYTEGLDLEPPGGPFVATSIAHGKDGEIYIAFITGKIFALYPKRQCDVRELANLNTKEASTPMGLAVHPDTGALYVIHQAGPETYPDPDPDPDHTKSAVSILRRDGTLERVADGLNSMLFEGMAFPISGSQGGEFDSAGNLYFAQGINDKSRERWRHCLGVETDEAECVGASPSDEWQSGIMKLDTDGNLSIWSSGHRSPYDVAVAKEDKRGRARFIFAGDNGEGEECANPEDSDSGIEEDCIEEFGSKHTIQLYDELNRAFEGSFHGFPEGYPPLASQDQADWKLPESHIGPIWKLGKVDALPDDGVGYDWPVPSGIDYQEGEWGEFDDPVFMWPFSTARPLPSRISAPSMSFTAGITPSGPLCCDISMVPLTFAWVPTASFTSHSTPTGRSIRSNQNDHSRHLIRSGRTLLAPRRYVFVTADNATRSVGDGFQPREVIRARRG